MAPKAFSVFGFKVFSFSVFVKVTAAGPTYYYHIIADGSGAKTGLMAVTTDPDTESWTLNSLGVFTWDTLPPGFTVIAASVSTFLSITRDDGAGGTATYTVTGALGDFIQPDAGVITGK